MLEEYQKMMSEAMKRVCFSDCEDDIVGLVGEWILEFVKEFQETFSVRKWKSS